MKKRTTGRTVFDRNHYKAKIMLRDPWFIKKMAWLEQRFAECGCPIPKKRFKTYKDYLAWNKDSFWERYSEISRSKEYRAKTQEITGGAQSYPVEILNQLDDLKDEVLPPMYGDVFRQILLRFDIDPNDRGFKDFLEFHLFLGRSFYPTRMFAISWKRKKPGNPAELFIQIFPHTRKEDILARWDWVVEEQQSFSDYMGKNKEWKNFERDMDIRDAYVVEKNMKNRTRALDERVWNRVHKKWPKLTIKSIPAIDSKTRKRIGIL